MILFFELINYYFLEDFNISKNNIPVEAAKVY
jgi:hypothetical protein